MFTNNITPLDANVNQQNNNNKSPVHQPNPSPEYQDISSGLAAMPMPIDINYVANNDPPAVKWLIEGWLRDDTYVGQLFGEQQTGKSFLLLLMCCCLACGRSYGPFVIIKTWRIALINVEDSKTQIHIRLNHIIQALEFTPEEVALIHQNLKVFPWQGRCGTINGPNTDSLKRLEEIIEIFQPNLMIGDTKSRLSHGNENSNDAQANLVRTLEMLMVKYKGPFIMAHHSTKSNSGTPRGGSAWESNIRLSINLKKMPPNMASEFGLSKEEAEDRAFEMICYDNYGGKNRAYFYKDPDTGVPRQIMPKHIVGDRVRDWLLKALEEHGPVNKNLLRGNRQSDDETVTVMMKSYPEVHGNKKILVSAAIQSLLEDGQIFEFQERRSVILTLQKPESEPIPEPAPEPALTPTERPELKVTRGRRSLRRSL